MKRLDNIKDNLKKRTYNAFYYNSNIEIVGNERAIIENCKHIIECNDIMVKILTAFFIITVWGSNLSISDYNKENVIINGKISSVEIEQKGKNTKNDI